MQINTCKSKVKIGVIMSKQKNNSENKSHLKGGDLNYSEEFRPLEVRVYSGNFERAFKAFRAIVQKDRILSLFKEKQSFEKPSVRKRRKRNESIRKAKEQEFKIQNWKNK